MRIFKTKKRKKTPITDKMFTGPATIQSIVDSSLSKLFKIQQVNFGEGVRNRFHAHTIEQVLIVTEGKGIVATENEELIVGPGDIVFIPAGEKHWHGAAKDSTFSHLYVMSPESQTMQLED
jgi:4-carboxymuconolactone decarboxylase